MADTFSIDRAELTESRSVSPIEANSNGETRGKTSELSRRPSSSLFPRTFLSWFLALVAALSFSPPSCLFYFLFYSRRVCYPAQGIVRIPNSYLNAVRSNFFFFFFRFKTFVLSGSIDQTRLCAFRATNLDKSRRNVRANWTCNDNLKISIVLISWKDIMDRQGNLNWSGGMKTTLEIEKKIFLFNIWMYSLSFVNYQ